MVYIDIDDIQSYARTTFTATSVPTLTEAQTYIDDSIKEIDEFSGKSWETHTAVQTIYGPVGTILLNDTPVVSITSVIDQDSVAVAFTQTGRDTFTIDTASPSKIVVTYQAGLAVAPTVIKKLAWLYWIRTVKQSESSTQGSSSSISVGSISIVNAIGTSTVVNMDRDIRIYEGRVRRLLN
jgi:hypothetical protein